MEHMKGSAEQSPTMLQQQQQLKKKLKTKKKNSHNANSINNSSCSTGGVMQNDVPTKTIRCDEEDDNDGHGKGNYTHDLSNQLNQQLQIDNGCISSKNKVNGLESSAKESLTQSCLQQQQHPALNGHHVNGAADNHIQDLDLSKQIKYKKNQPELNANGHCLDVTKPNVDKLSNNNITNGVAHVESVNAATSTPFEVNTAINVKETAQQQLSCSSNSKAENDASLSNKSAVEQDSAAKNSEVVQNPIKELDLSNVHIEYKQYESELQMHVSNYFKFVCEQQKLIA